MITTIQEYEVFSNAYFIIAPENNTIHGAQEVEEQLLMFEPKIQARCCLMYECTSTKNRDRPGIYTDKKVKSFDSLIQCLGTGTLRIWSGYFSGAPEMSATDMMEEACRQLLNLKWDRTVTRSASGAILSERVSITGKTGTGKFDDLAVVMQLCLIAIVLFLKDNHRQYAKFK